MANPEFVKEIIEAGVHFGHRCSRWNPKMKPFIYGKRNLIHIIDVRQTLKGVLVAKKFLNQIVLGGKDVLLVGTKRQARTVVEEIGKATGMPFVAERWLGGMLTNYSTIRSRLQRLEELEATLQAPDVSKKFSKKMESSLKREYRKILRNLSGVRTMNRLPGAVLVIDVKREAIAVREARTLGIPVIGIIDTDSDPDMVDIAIPANDDAMRALDLMLKEITSTLVEAKASRTQRDEPQASKDGDQRQQKPRRRRTTTAQFENDAAKPDAAAEAPSAQA